MRAIVRCCLVAAMIAGLVDWPAAAAVASEKPLGVVLVAEHAHFGSAKAAVGSTVYAGDSLDTEASGTLCLQMGTGQVFLLPESAATFGQDGPNARIALTRGTTVFSAPAPGQLEVETPAGTLRGAAGQAASGRVQLLGPAELVIAARDGDLVLDNDGELHTIPAGKAVRVVIENPEAVAAVGTPAPGTVQRGRNRRKLLFYMIVLAGVGGISAIISNKLSESSYRP